MSVIILGSMAFDAIETPFGKVDKIVGGSAIYAAYAVSYFVKPVNLMGIIGNDFDETILEDLKERGVSIAGVQIITDKPSFFWSGRYHQDMNNRDTLITDLNALSDLKPIIPESYQAVDFLMLGNLMPSVQMSVIWQLKDKPAFVVMDTMNLWIETALSELKTVLQQVDVLMVNDVEARQLSGQFSIVRAAQIIMEMGPRFIIIKRGEHGALLFHKNSVFFAPALPLEEVIDPTGAGDTFAGGFIGYLAKTKDTSLENLKTAVTVGCAMASFCVEKFGPQRLQELTLTEIQARIQMLANLVDFKQYD